MDTIDLRSDTVSWPTPKMREAMANAAVGDDVYGEDPTVNQLEAEAAEMLGKEAGLLVTSGTMGNVTAVLTHCSTRGSEFIVGKQAHIFRYEGGGAAALGGVHPNTLQVNPDGTLDLGAIREALPSHTFNLPGKHTGDGWRYPDHGGIYGRGRRNRQAERPETAH
jgi:threonine aldolase